MKLKIYSSCFEFNYERPLDPSEMKDMEKFEKNMEKEAADIVDGAIHSFSLHNEIPLSKKSRGFFPDPDVFFGEVWLELIDYAEKKFGELMLYEVHDNTNQLIVNGSVSVGSIVDIFFEDYIGTVHVGRIILLVLENFLKNGVWQFGFRKEDGTVIKHISNWPDLILDNSKYIWRGIDGLYEPIIWFGLIDEDPIDCWILSRAAHNFEFIDINQDYFESEPIYGKRWKSFWFNASLSFNWNILFGTESEDLFFWMFVEYLMEEPKEFLDIVKSNCPIHLNENDEDDDLIRKIDEFFLLKSRN